VNRVTLYTKPQCSLCDDALDVIEQAKSLTEFNLELRNILDDPQDYDRYKHDIPVILLNGREIARHRLTLPQLLAALQESPP
jgi:glutaredoxin